MSHKKSIYNTEYFGLVNTLENQSNIVFAFMFGSRTKRKERFGSDLDIAVYFKEEPPLLDIGKLVNELEEASGYKVDLISLNDIHKKNPRLAFSVLAEGMLLFSNNEKVLNEFRKKVYLEYFDFLPVINLFNIKLKDRVNNKKFAVVEK